MCERLLLNATPEAQQILDQKLVGIGNAIVNVLLN